MTETPVAAATGVCYTRRNVLFGISWHQMASVPASKYPLHTNARTALDQAGISIAELARQAGVDRSVLTRALNPSRYGRSGALQGRTAWKLARAYAHLTATSEEDGLRTLFEVIEGDQDDA
jgi:hypothetical protein